MGLLMAYYGALLRILSGLTRSADHLSIYHVSTWGPYFRPHQNADKGSGAQLSGHAFKLTLRILVPKQKESTLDQNDDSEYRNP